MTPVSLDGRDRFYRYKYNTDGHGLRWSKLYVEYFQPITKQWHEVVNWTTRELIFEKVKGLLRND